MILEFLVSLYDSLYAWVHNAIITFKFHHIFQYFFYLSVLLYSWRTIQQIVEHLSPVKPQDIKQTPTYNQIKTSSTTTDIVDDEKKIESRGEWIDDEDDESKAKTSSTSKSTSTSTKPPPIPPRTHRYHQQKIDPMIPQTLTLLRTHIVDVIAYHEYHLKQQGPGILFIDMDMATNDNKTYRILDQFKSPDVIPKDWESLPLYLNAEKVLRTGDDTAISMLKSYNPICEMIWTLYHCDEMTYQPKCTYSYRILYDKQNKKITSETDQISVPV